jgi:acyl-homoserine-lactone acylase
MEPTRSHLAALLVVYLAACGGDDGGDDTDVVTPEYAARIQRTSFGIPHVQADDEKGLGYGIGYAFAEDSPCQLAEEIVTARGRRSLYFGPDAVYDPDGNGVELGNLASDVYYRVLNEDRLVEATWDSQPAELEDLLSGYARGFNRRLEEVGAGGLPEPCRDKPWVRAVTELDLITVMRRYTVEASGKPVIDGFFAAAPPTGDAVARTAPAALGAALLARFRPTKGSNGVALGRDATASGEGLLLANPHFPWRGTFRFYQLHITIPGVVDAAGVGLAGLPIVGIGHNADLAWTHTVNTSRHFAFHLLALDPADPTRYLVDGRSVAMTSRVVAVEVAREDGTTGTIEHTVWSTEMGPVDVLPGLVDWTPEAVLAFADANLDNTRMMEAWWGINRARSLEELRAAIETTLGIPWVNTIAVDAAGTAYLGDVTPVPDISEDMVDACVPEPLRPLAASGLVVLDGSRSACRWGRSAGAVRPGLVPAAALPALTRTDFVQNSNDSAWCSNPAAPLVGFPPIVSAEGQPLNPRTRLGLQEIEDVLASGERFTAGRLQEMTLSNRAFFAASLLDDLRAVCAAAPGDDVARACTVLDAWDGAAELTSVGWPLFKAWRRALDQAAAEAGVDIWATPFDPSDPVHTPRGLRADDPAVSAAARAALVSATAELDDAGIDFTRAWGDLQVARMGGGDIPIHGGGGDHFGDGGDEIYNTINSRPTGDGRLEPFYGSTFVLTVAFESGRPTAQGFMTYSTSSDPASPHAADQTERFSRKEWITFPFDPGDIAADPALVTTDIEE